MKQTLLMIALAFGFITVSMPVSAEPESAQTEQTKKGKAKSKKGKSQKDKDKDKADDEDESAEKAEKAKAREAAKRQAAAANWVKREITTARKAATLIKGVKNNATATRIGNQLKKLLKPYEDFYGTSVAHSTPAKLRLPAGVQAPDFSRLQAAKGAEPKLPAGLTREDITAAQKRAAAQRKQVADLMRKNHKLVDQAVRDNYSTCGGNGPTNDMETGYIDSAAHFVIQYMCSQP